MTIKQVLHRLNRRDFRFFPKISTPLKIFLVILFVFSTVLLSQKIFAQETNPIKEKQDAMMKGNNQEAWLDNAMGSNLMSLQVIMGGTIPDEILEQKIDPIGGETSYIYQPQGLIGFTNQAISSLYNPPASGIEYIAQIKNNFLNKPAYAADDGFQGLSGIMDLWKAFRNVSYALIAIIFIIIGIMIMLRIKMSPQAIVTIQSSLPKVITTLILITFSYAIAGLVIDLMNLFLSLSVSLLFTGLGTDPKDNLFHVSGGDWSITNLITWIRSLFGDNSYNYNALANANLYELFLLIKRLVPNTMLVSLGALIGGIFGSAAGPGGAIIFGAGSALAITAIISLIVLIQIIKLAFGLTKCYIKAVIQVVFAPFILLVGAFPTSKGKFGSWLTTLIANLSVFPITVLFLILANLFIDRLAKFEIWAPTLVSGPVDWMLPIIVGIVATTMLSKLPQIIPEAIFQLKPASYDKAIGEAFGNSLVAKAARGISKETGERMSGQVVNRVGGAKKVASQAVADKFRLTKAGNYVENARLANWNRKEKKFEKRAKNDM